jgi:riboflavin kinase/FMN adenylyltransferase
MKVLFLLSFHIQNGFTGEIRNKLLNTMEENPFIGKHGIQNLVIHPFDTVFSLTAEEFVRTVLVNQFDIHKISSVMTTDLEIVQQTLTTLLILEKYGFEVEQISVQEINDLSVSSTKIRKAISEGYASGKNI